MSELTNEKLMSVAEVADYLAAPARTVRYWAQKKILPALQLPNGQYRFRRRDLDRFLYRCRIPPPSSQ